MYISVQVACNDQGHESPWIWSYRWLLATMWVLRTESSAEQPVLQSAKLPLQSILLIFLIIKALSSQCTVKQSDFFIVSFAFYNMLNIAKMEKQSRTQCEHSNVLGKNPYLLLH